MLPKQKRIPRDSFGRILSLGLLQNSPHFLLRTISAPKEGYAALVSKKVAQSAVDRNRVRRRVYAVIRVLLPQIKKTSHTVISAKQGANKITFAVLQSEIEELFHKARLM